MKERQNGVESSVRSSQDGTFYFVVNDEESGAFVENLNLNKNHNFQKVSSPEFNSYITDLVVLDDWLVRSVLDQADPKIQYVKKGEEKWRDLKLKLGIGQYYITKDKIANQLRISFSSPGSGHKQFTFNLETKELKETLVKIHPRIQQQTKRTVVERIWVKSHDGIKVPVTLIKSAMTKNKAKGVILKTYGAYGANTIPEFNLEEMILLSMGYQIAYAHIRGESVMGKSWYKEGRSLKKENTLLDYISCARYLHQKGYVPNGNLVGYGVSAGGVVLGYAANEYPDLFRGMILDRPYLDVVNTMMDEKLPLTIDEYKEWGNPQNEEEVFDYILSYSPYQNIKHQNYPNMLFLGSFKDLQTPIWQIAQHVSKLRDHNLANTQILLLTDLDGDHSGGVNQKKWMKIFAKVGAFLEEIE